MTVIGVLLVGAAALLVGAAMFLADQHEEVGELFGAYQKAKAGKNGKGSSGEGMEIRGHWQGLAVAGLDSPTAQSMGLGQVDKGVAVVGIDPQQGGRARQAGVQVGDVVVGVDQKPVRNLPDAMVKSFDVKPGTPIMLDVQRQGQLITLVLPPAPTPAAAMSGPQLYCPRDGVLVPAAQAGPGTTCPICGGALHIYDARAGVR